MQNGEYKFVNAIGNWFLFFDKDSSLDDVVRFAHRFNVKKKDEEKFVYIKCEEGTIEIKEE
jgi:hypothetical protein